MDVFVLGLAIHPPAAWVAEKRLEEMVFDTAYAALQDAGVRRAEIDHVTIAACDELDGRSISSMLLAAPAGAYLRDEIKATDSGLTGLCLGAMRVASGELDLGLVVSWNKSSKAPVEDVMRMRCDPFFIRPIGLNRTIADGLFAQSVAAAYGFDDAAASAAMLENYRRAARNPRGLGHPAPPAASLAQSDFVAAPLRRGHQAPITDGAVALVLASQRWLSRHPGAFARARIAGLGWRTESYSLGRERLGALHGFRGAVGEALRTAGCDAEEVDLAELDSQTAFHHLAYAQALKERGFASELSPGGGALAQNPYFCTGLVNAAECVLQVSDGAGPVQVPAARRALAHGQLGFAQQGNLAVLFERC
jgi:acetyl-CoA acetyltransferase